MVYESDYTTRRVYSGSRPGISTSYSISPYYQELPQAALRRPDLFMTYAPGFGKGRKQHRVIVPVPRIVHQRLIQVSAPPRRHRATNVYDALDYGRSGNQYVLVNYRPTPPPPRSRVTYIEDVTNSSNFDDLNKETRDLQRDMDNMYMRVALGIPLHPTRSLYNMHHIPMRSASEVKEVADMRRMYVRANNPLESWSPLNKPNLYRMPLVYKADPAAFAPSHYYIGRGNLACLSYAGGRPIPKRRRFYPGYEDKVLDDVTFRSFYTKVRNAANSAAAARGRTPLYQPIHYSRKTIMGGNPEPKREITESKWVQRAMANEKEPQERKPAVVVKRDSVKEVSGARRESLTKEPRPEPPQSGRPINVTLPGPRKSVTEIIREELPKVVNLPEQSITVRRPSTLKEAVSESPVDTRADETVVIPKAAKPVKEPSPPPREPTPPPPREPTPPPPKEPTPPPKEPTPPPREPTPPPPKEPTPEPKVVVEEPAVVEEEEAPAPAQEEVSVTSEAAAVETPAVSEGQGGAGSAAEVTEEKTGGAEEEVGLSEEGSNKGEVEDIQLEEEVTLDEVCEVQVDENDLEIEEDEPAVENETAVTEEVAGDAAEEPAAQEPTDAAQDSGPNVLDEETPVGVSIHVADIDGPVEVDPDLRNDEQEHMTVEQIQAEAERRRIEFARLLEEHHDIVEKVDRLEHPEENKNTLEPVAEELTPAPTPTPEMIPNDTENEPEVPPPVTETTPTSAAADSIPEERFASQESNLEKV